MWYANDTDGRKDDTVDFKYPGDEKIVVHGAEMLGFGTSDRTGKDRWTEVTVVGTETGYFVAGSGHSRLPGETTRHWCAAFSDANELIKGLLRGDGRGGRYLPAYARTALELAGTLDQDVYESLEKYDVALRQPA